MGLAITQALDLVLIEEIHSLFLPIRSGQTTGRLRHADVEVKAYISGLWTSLDRDDLMPCCHNALALIAAAIFEPQFRIVDRLVGGAKKVVEITKLFLDLRDKPGEIALHFLPKPCQFSIERDRLR